MKTNSNPGSKNGGHASANGRLTKYVPPANIADVIESAAEVSLLTTEQQTELRRCEAVIKEGWDTFVEVGRALATIRNKELYKEKFTQFDDYCRERWGYSKTHANRLIGAADVVNILTPIGATVESESQVRALTGLKEATVKKAWDKATELAKGGKVTAKIVRLAVNELVGKPQKKKPSAATPSKNLSTIELLEKIEKSVNDDNRDAALKFLWKLKKLLIPKG